MGKVSMKLFTEVLRSEYENRMIKMTTKSVFLPPRPSENLDFLLFITVLRAYKAL